MGALGFKFETVMRRNAVDSLEKNACADARARGREERFPLAPRQCSQIL